MKKSKVKIRKKARISLIVATALTVLFLTLGTFSAFAGIRLQERFPVLFDTALYEAAPLPPRFFAWDFTDRQARIGERYPLEDQVVCGNGFETYVPYEALPADLVNAFVAIEDRRFFSHNGIDWPRLCGAALNYLVGDRHPFGASTITQQLVKNATGADEITLRRKFLELRTAKAIEERMSKEEILERYLNMINLSEGCFGVGTAAKFYFDKDVNDLTLAEDATLAAITQNPSRYDPARHPDENRARRDLILREMARQGMIGEDELEKALKTYVTTVKRNREKPIMSWYTETVVKDVLRDLVTECGYTKAEAERLLYRGGLSIEVAMDASVQAVLEAFYRDPTRFPTDENGKRAESGVVVIDPKTGDILGLVGAVGPKTGDRLQNFATDTCRPAGSVIKPLAVYAPALEYGLITFGSVYDDVPVEIGEPTDDASTGFWPQNADRVYRGLTDIPTAVAHSLNTVPVRILAQLGTARSYAFAKDRFHLWHLLPSDRNAAGLALGQQEKGLTLREVTAAYTVFPNEGKYSGARSYYRVLSADGEVLLSTPDLSETVLSRENAYIMTQLLCGVIREGTASDVTLGRRVACAGKTGTTSFGFDKWFVGYTPEILTGVWVGMPYPVGMVDATTAATSVFDDVMGVLYDSGRYRIGSFQEPEGVVEARYCRDSGGRPDAACKVDARGDRGRIGYFAAGTEPVFSCDRHILVAYDGDRGIANGYCDKNGLRRVGLVRVERHFPRPILITDAQFTWQDLPAGIEPAEDEGQPFFGSLYGEGDFPGVSPGGRQFNRICTFHDAAGNRWEKEERPVKERWWERLFGRYSYGHGDAFRE